MKNFALIGAAGFVAPRHLKAIKEAVEFQHFEQANVKWFLSVNYDHILEEIKALGKRTNRSLVLEREEIEFSDGFNELHRLSYERISMNKGFSIKDVLNPLHWCRTLERRYDG